MKAACPLDVLLAQQFAEAADTVGFSMDCRLESLAGLHEVLARLKDRADEIEDDSDEIYDESDQFERSTNGHH